MLVVQPLYGEEDTQSKGIKVVKSLFDHRRQDVREAAAREAAEQAAREEQKQPSFTGGSNKLVVENQLRLVETLLQTRMMTGSKFNAGNTAEQAIRAVCDRAEEAEEPISITWSDEAGDDEAVRLVDDIDLSGCNMAEALHRICASANCQYIVRNGQVVLERVGRTPRSMSLVYYKEVVDKCFETTSVFPREDGRRIVGRHSKHDKGETLDIIRKKRWGVTLNRKVAGEYSRKKEVLKLTAMPYTLLVCIQDLDTLYYQWLGGSYAKRIKAENLKSKRFRMEQKLAAALAVPIELPRSATVEDVVKYFTLVCRYSKLKTNIRFSAERGDLTGSLLKPLKIETCSILDALFCACDTMQGSYSFRHPRITFVPGELETRKYTTRFSMNALLKEEEGKKHVQKAGRTPQPQVAHEVSDSTVISTLRMLGIQLPLNSRIVYEASTNMLQVEADPRSIYRLNRHVEFVEPLENP